MLLRELDQQLRNSFQLAVLTAETCVPVALPLPTLEVIEGGEAVAIAAPDSKEGAGHCDGYSEEEEEEATEDLSAAKGRELEEEEEKGDGSHDHPAVLRNDDRSHTASCNESPHERSPCRGLPCLLVGGTRSDAVEHAGDAEGGEEGGEGEGSVGGHESSMRQEGGAGSSQEG